MLEETEDLALLRHLLERQAGPEEVSTAETSVAMECGQLREAISAAIGPAEACRSCARGCPAPAGYYDGGKCCSHSVRKLFDGDHLAMLRAVGTSASELAAPKSAGEGCCAFRTADGCVLAARLRPNSCVYYLCEELEAEFEARGRLAEVHNLRDTLENAHRRFQGDS